MTRTEPADVVDGGADVVYHLAHDQVEDPPVSSAAAGSPVGPENADHITSPATPLHRGPEPPMGGTSLATARCTTSSTSRRCSPARPLGLGVDDDGRGHVESAAASPYTGSYRPRRSHPARSACRVSLRSGIARQRGIRQSITPRRRMNSRTGSRPASVLHQEDGIRRQAGVFVGAPCDYGGDGDV